MTKARKKATRRRNQAKTMISLNQLHEMARLTMRVEHGLHKLEACMRKRGLPQVGHGFGTVRIWVRCVMNDLTRQYFLP